MKIGTLAIAALALLAYTGPARAAEVSTDTKACFNCHEIVTPGIVDDWYRGLHSRVTPTEALGRPLPERRFSTETVPEDVAKVVVGCAECHTMNPEKHPDTFEHNGFQVHVVVTPEDCAVCHPVEREQYSRNIMSRAHGNLQGNAVYHQLAEQVNGSLTFDGTNLSFTPPSTESTESSCIYCHGTVVEKTGMRSRPVTLGGEMSFPVLSGWPNQGVGRVNPDKSLGSCSACHTRHMFSIEMARRPDTCSQCHKGPDVPAFSSYMVSKHGNIYAALEDQWDFKAVPWKAGTHFIAPTCATCHISLVTDSSGEVVAQRSHSMEDRLPWRIMGLIYAHPYPKSPDTTIIRNKAGLPLPTELTGEPASEFLIDKAEQDKRRKLMTGICTTCHSTEWVENHFRRHDTIIAETNKATLEATKIMLAAWEKGAAKGLAQQDSIFNEALERKWVEQWLFYANSTRFASAMSGADYGVFAYGRWYLTKNLQEMKDWLDLKLKLNAK